MARFWLLSGAYDEASFGRTLRFKNLGGQGVGHDIGRFLCREVILQIAVLTFDGFNELDSFVAAAILNRLAAKGWKAHITSPTPEATSMNGVTVKRQKPLEFVAEADAVIIGSGIKTREIAADRELLSRIRLDPKRQLIGAQCSGTLLLAKLGLVGDLPACTDLTTKPWVIEAGVKVLDAPFVAHGNVATAGGCFASQYLATWMIGRNGSIADAEAAMHYVAPVGEKQSYVERALAVIAPFLPVAESAAA
jgi:transcriptional regulator GlxA family with amidase domain